MHFQEKLEQREEMLVRTFCIVVVVVVVVVVPVIVVVVIVIVIVVFVVQFYIKFISLNNNVRYTCGIVLYLV
jgi:hypothetical protein